jgi:putative addiction module killer protein
LVEITETPQFSRWLQQLRDLQAKVRIQTRIDRLSLGLPGDVRAVGGGVSELRIHHGPGYRVYFTTLEPTMVLLLIGGDKRTQDRDISRAIKMAKSL